MNRIRGSVLAGTWYPGERAALKTTIERYLSGDKIILKAEHLYGLIVPHAGYMYSGKTAGSAYALIETLKIENVVILSPLHHFDHSKYVINGATHYETPLGLVPVNLDMVDKLKTNIDVQMVNEDREHSIEIQLPFLQAQLKNFKIIPVMVAHGDIYQTDDIVDTLYDLLNGTDSLIVASSDMHHDSSYSNVLKNDHEIMEAVASFDMEKLKERLSHSNCTVCGKLPISIMLEVSRKLGARKIKIIQQTNSADVTGEKERSEYVVGYMSAAVLG